MKLAAAGGGVSYAVPEGGSALSPQVNHPQVLQGDTFIWKTPFISEMTNFFSNLMYPTYITAKMMKQLFTDLESGVHVGLTICAGSFDIQDF